MCCSSQCGKRSCHLGPLVVSHKPSLLSSGPVLYATHLFITCSFSQPLDYRDVEVPLFKQSISFNNGHSVIRLVMLATQVCQRSPKVLPLIEKAQVLRGKKENLCAEAAQGYGESKLLSGNSGKREKEAHTAVLLHL